MQISYDGSDLDSLERHSELIFLIKKALTTLYFKIQHGLVGTYSVDFLRNVFHSRYTITPHFLHAVPQGIPKKLMTRLIAIITPMIANFYNDETGTIGIRRSSTSQHHASIEDLALYLLRAAAILGPERAATLFSGWIYGSPSYRRRIWVMRGVKSPNEVKIDEGITVVSPPHPTAVKFLSTCPSSPPPNTRDRERDVEVFNKRTVLITTTSIQPVFFRPRDRGVQTDPDWGARWGRSCNEGMFPFREFCDALELICNCVIEAHWSWSDVCDQDVFNGPRLGIRCPSTKRIWGNWFMPECEIGRNELEAAFKIFSKRRTLPKGEKKRLDIAVGRWRRARAHRRSLDSFIDLRIALEALYLAGGWGELSHRLSVRAAWHLGGAGPERFDIFETLRKFYDYSSKIIHAGTANIGEPQIELFKQARDICRRGLLKRFNGVQEPDWNRMIIDG